MAVSVRRAASTSLPMTQGRRTTRFQSDVIAVRGEIEEDEEENVEGLVCKSNGFLHMNLSNPKEEFFDTEGTDCIGEARSTTTCLKEKLEGGFSRGITMSFFNSSNRVWVLTRSSC